uniref:Aspartate 1-decarboxylase n=1 Tax=Ammonifex degensii TaxID=42838 RepID=A0A7C1F3Z1_9THEO
MLIAMLRGKIHQATVKETNLHYPGSITIDEALLEAADILPREKVQVVNINNGVRFETYTIAGPRDSGIVGLNGAAARCGAPGDQLIIIAYALVPYQEARSLRPRIVVLDGANRVVEVKHEETVGLS